MANPRRLSGTQQRQECADCGSHTRSVVCGNCKGYHLVALNNSKQPSRYAVTAQDKHLS